MSLQIKVSAKRISVNATVIFFLLWTLTPFSEVRGQGRGAEDFPMDPVTTVFPFRLKINIVSAWPSMPCITLHGSLT